MRKALLLCLALCGCAAAAATAEKVNATEDACDRAIHMLEADHAAGLSCPTARQHVQGAVPDCKLVFTCKDDPQ